MDSRGLCIGAVVCLFSVLRVDAGTTRYVNDSCGNDAWSGAQQACSAPNGPKRTIQAAFDASGDGDAIIVADGVYTGPGNRDLDFAGRNITVRSSGGAANCVIDCQSAGRAFLATSGETDVVLEGLTMTNGHVDIGGALLVVGSTVTVTGCAFIDRAGPTSASDVA